MTLTYHFLKFPTQEAAQDALISVFGVDENGGVLTASHTHALTILGTLYRDDTPEGEPPVAKSGYHANLAIVGDVPEALQAYVIPRPTNPNVVYENGQG